MPTFVVLRMILYKIWGRPNVINLLQSRNSAMHHIEVHISQKVQVFIIDWRCKCSKWSQVK